MKILLLTSVLLAATAAQAADPYNLSALDKFKTCQTTSQKATALRSLTWLKDFKWWHIRNVMDAFHPDLQIWHSSLAYLVQQEPGLPVPFPKGQISYKTAVPSLAFIAYANDKAKYEIIPSRLDCIGDNDTIVTTEFTGLQVARDAKGYITHAVPFGSATKVIFNFKEEQIYRLYFDLDDRTSYDVRIALKSLLRQPPNVERDEATRQTYPEILADFQAQAK